MGIPPTQARGVPVLTWRGPVRQKSRGENAVDSIRLVAEHLQGAVHGALDPKLRILTATFIAAAAEIEQMKAGGSFSQERLEKMATHLQNSWDLFQRHHTIHVAI